VRDAETARTLFGSIGLSGQVLATDLTEAGGVAKLVTECTPAAIFNLAGYGVDPSERNAAIAAKVNAELPPALVRAMRDNGDRRWAGQQVIHAGSALEYGTASGDLAETTSEHPTTLYGITKLEGTRTLIDTSRELGMRSVTARLFTVYGPGEHSGRLLPTLIDARYDKKPIPLTDGRQERDFTYVADVVEGLLRLGTLPGDDLGVVNVATGTQTPVRQFVETAAEVLGLERSRLDFGAIPSRAEEQRHDAVNVGKMRSLTGWTPSVTIREGITRSLPAPPAPHWP
jgi:UDP-glucose 4-epimerase